MIINRRASDFRRESREALRGKWGTAILISLIYGAIIALVITMGTWLALVTPILSLVVGIAFILIMPPLTYGISYAYYHLKNGEYIIPIDFLKVGFSNFGRGWKIALQILKKCWWCILLVLIPVILGLLLFAIVPNMSSVSSSKYFSSYSYDDYYDKYSSYLDDYDNYYGYKYKDYNYNYKLDNNKVSSAIGNILGSVFIAILYIGICVLVITKILLYVLSYYIAASDENISPKEAVLQSEKLMKGNRGKYFCLVMSFFGWSLLAYFVSDAILDIGNHLFYSVYMLPIIVQVILSIIIALISNIGTIILNPYIVFATIAFYQELDRIQNSSYDNMNSFNNENNINMNQSYMNQNINNQNVANQFNAESQSTKVCMYCRTINAKDANYCINCGNKL